MFPTGSSRARRTAALQAETLERQRLEGGQAPGGGWPAPVTVALAPKVPAESWPSTSNMPVPRSSWTDWLPDVRVALVASALSLAPGGPTKLLLVVVAAYHLRRAKLPLAPGFDERSAFSIQEVLVARLSEPLSRLRAGSRGYWDWTCGNLRDYSQR